ncbi:MAG: hypothetical protein M1431_06410 [Candidatus Thermoplasmatota archaeon]|nr:hypothetical protein [Candidatus Thermoplasmatota archaeon]
MIYHRHRGRKPEYDSDLERPSYGTRRVIAIIRRSGARTGRNRIRRHMRHMNLFTTHKKVHRKHVPKTIVVQGQMPCERRISRRYTLTAGDGYISQHTMIYAPRR